MPKDSEINKNIMALKVENAYSPLHIHVLLKLKKKNIFCHFVQIFMESWDMRIKFLG